MLSSILSALGRLQPVMILKTLSPLGKVGGIGVFILLEEGVYRVCRKYIPDTHGEFGPISPNIQRRIIAIGVAYGLTLHIAKLAGAILAVPTSATCVAVVCLIAIRFLYCRQQTMVHAIYTPQEFQQFVAEAITDSLPIPPGRVILIRNVEPKQMLQIQNAKGDLVHSAKINGLIQYFKEIHFGKCLSGFYTDDPWSIDHSSKAFRKGVMTIDPVMQTIAIRGMIHIWMVKVPINDLKQWLSEGKKLCYGPSQEVVLIGNQGKYEEWKTIAKIEELLNAGIDPAYHYSIRALSPTEEASCIDVQTHADGNVLEYALRGDYSIHDLTHTLSSKSGFTFERVPTHP
jgi:hypothetical protein